MIARRRKKMTQRQLAARVGVSPSHISDIERGEAKPAHTVIVNICEILNIVEPETLTTEGGEI